MSKARLVYLLSRMLYDLNDRCWVEDLEILENEHADQACVERIHPITPAATKVHAKVFKDPAWNSNMNDCETAEIAGQRFESI